jgi:hypothetical protein
MIKAEVAARLAAAGRPPRVLTASALVGAERSPSCSRARTTSTRAGSGGSYATIGLAGEPGVP